MLNSSVNNGANSQLKCEGVASTGAVLGVEPTSFATLDAVFNKEPRDERGTEKVTVRHAVSDANVPGNMAVWVLIFAELTEFAFFFVLFLVAKANDSAAFSEGALQLNTTAGIWNTLILLTSSYFMARAIAAIRRDDSRRCLLWLAMVLIMGLAYCGVKAWEYQWNLEAGISVRTNTFFSVYYYLTFNHLLHVLIGMCCMLWIAVRTLMGSYSAQEHEGLESAACYWHMIDLAWIIIFPLLYVLR